MLKPQPQHHLQQSRYPISGATIYSMTSIIIISILVRAFYACIITVDISDVCSTSCYFCITLYKSVERNNLNQIESNQIKLDQTRLVQSLCMLLKTFFFQVFQIFLAFLWFILFFILFLHTLFFTVLAGKTDRFASTHRVCRTDGHTYLSIKHRCLAALQVGMIFIFSCPRSFFSDFHLIFFFATNAT